MSALLMWWSYKGNEFIFDDKISFSNMANCMGAYTLADRGTYAAMTDKLDMGIVVQGDPLLFNQYGVMAVSPEKIELPIPRELKNSLSL